MLSLISIILLSYLVGSFPTAILVGRVVLKDDIRNFGSGNAGATNVFRVMGWKAGLFVFLIDVGKGALAPLVLAHLSLDAALLPMPIVQIIAGLAAIVGHIWTVFAEFKGGKGVGTAFGVLLGFAPVPALLAFAVWIILVAITRIVSVGSIAAGVALPLSMLIQRHFSPNRIPNSFLIFGILIGLLVVITHRANIKRLLRGEENKFGSSKSKKEQA